MFRMAQLRHLDRIGGLRFPHQLVSGTREWPSCATDDESAWSETGTNWCRSRSKGGGRPSARNAQTLRRRADAAGNEGVGRGYHLAQLSPPGIRAPRSRAKWGDPVIEPLHTPRNCRISPLANVHAISAPGIPLACERPPASVARSGRSGTLPSLRQLVSDMCEWRSCATSSESDAPFPDDRTHPRKSPR